MFGFRPTGALGEKVDNTRKDLQLVMNCMEAIMRELQEMNADIDDLYNRMGWVRKKLDGRR